MVSLKLKGFEDMDIPSAIAVQNSIAKQNVTLSLIKESAEQAQAVANILQQSVDSVQVNTSRGTSVNISA